MMNELGWTGEMIDEAQNAFKKNPELASIYNAGHVKDTAYVSRVEKINEDLAPVRFNVFCPKVLALKGKIRDDSLQGRALFEITDAQVQRGGHDATGVCYELRRVSKIERLRNLLVALLREHERDGTIRPTGDSSSTSLSSADT